VFVKTIMILMVPRRYHQLLGTDSVACGDVTVPYVYHHFQSIKLNFSLERAFLIFKQNIQKFIFTLQVERIS